jgi:hypothetical protein
MADDVAIFNGGESPLAKAVNTLVQGQTSTMAIDGGAAPSPAKEKEGLLADTAAGAGGDPPLGGVVTAG